MPVWPDLKYCVDWDLSSLCVQYGVATVILEWNPQHPYDPADPYFDKEQPDVEKAGEFYCEITSRNFFSIAHHDERSWQYNPFYDPPPVFVAIEDNVTVSHIPGITPNLETNPNWTRYRIAAGDEHVEIIAKEPPDVRIEPATNGRPCFLRWPDEAIARSELKQ